MLLHLCALKYRAGLALLQFVSSPAVLTDTDYGHILEIFYCVADTLSFLVCTPTHGSDVTRTCLETVRMEVENHTSVLSDKNRQEIRTAFKLSGEA